MKMPDHPRRDYPDQPEVAPVPTAVHPDDELVTAYLDGELTQDEVATFESRLSGDSQLRKRLQQQQRSWDLLDQLPSAELNRNFTRSTIEMAVAEECRQRPGSLRNYFRIAILAAASLSLLAAGVTAGFILVRGFQQEDDRMVVRNLSFFKHVEAYDNIHSLEFLQALEKEADLPQDISELEFSNGN